MNGTTLPSLDKTRRYRPVCSCGEAPVGNVLRGGRWVEAPWCPRCAPTSAVVLPPKGWDRQRLVRP